MTEPPPQEEPADPLRDALAACIERIAETGHASAAEPILAAHPTLAPELRERLGKLHRAGMLPIADGASPPPEQLGEFRLLRPLGRGGMGVVHLARQESLDRLVALKLVHPELLYFPGARERFRREVETVARLQHPGIVPIYTVGEAHGVPYFAMEYVQGITLADAIADLQDRQPGDLRGADFATAIARRTQLEVEAAPFAGSWLDVCSRLLVQTAAAVQHAHERGVLHRDLKPSNAMVTPAGRALLLDFGLAAASGADTLTRSGATIGTLAYMAPEQVRGESLDARCDVYALGAILYELLTLRAAHHADSGEALRASILRGDVPPLRTFLRGAPRDLDTICRVAMAPERERRYTSAAAFAADLERFLAHRPIAARPAGPLLRGRRFVRRHPAATAALAVLLVAASTVGWFVAQRDTAKQESAANLRSALDAIGVLVARARSPELSAKPGLDPIRMQQLDDAVALLGHLGQQNADDPEAQLALARGLLEAANLRRELGAAAAAQSAHALAERTLAALVERHPERRDFVHEHARALRLGSALRRDAGDLPGAERALLAVLEHCDRLGDRDEAPLLALRAGALADLARFDQAARRFEAAEQRLLEATRLDARRLALGKDPFALADAARTRNSLSTLLLKRGAAEAALAGFREVAAWHEELVAARPGDPEVQRERARSQTAVAGALRALGKGDEAIAATRAALAAFERLHADFPLRTQYEWERNMVGFELGQTAEAAHDDSTAETAYRQALERHESLRQRQPEKPELGSEAAIVGLRLAALLRRTGRADEALPRIERAIELLEALLATNDTDSHWRSNLVGARNDAGRVHLERHDATAAIPHLRRMLELVEQDHDRKPGPETQKKLAYGLQMLAYATAAADDADGAMALVQRLQQEAPIGKQELLAFVTELHLEERADCRALLAAAKD